MPTSALQVEYPKRPTADLRHFDPDCLKKGRVVVLHIVGVPGQSFCAREESSASISKNHNSTCAGGFQADMDTPSALQLVR